MANLVGERIKQIRINKKMTQKEVAEKCGFADSALRKYESGLINPKFETVSKIATALGVTPAYLMGIETEESPIYGKEYSKYTQLGENMEQQRLRVGMTRRGLKNITIRINIKF